MDSDSFKSVIICGQCGEWFGNMLSQVHHLTTHSFTKTAGTKSVLNFLERCDGDAPDQSEYAHADASPGCSFDKWSPSADDVLYDEKNGTEAYKHASVSHQRDRLDIAGDCGESLGCNSHLHQVNCECVYNPSGGEHETDDIAGMGDYRACLFRDGDQDSVHLGQTDQNCEDLSGSEVEVPETSGVLSSGTDEDSQDAESKLSDLEHEDNESPCKFESRLERHYEATAFDVKDTSPENSCSVENKNESSTGMRSKTYDGYDYISDENEDSPDTPVNDICEFKFYQSNRGENTRMGQMLNTNSQDGMKVYLNTGLDKRKYNSVEGSMNSMGGMGRGGSLWDDTLQTDQTLSSSQMVTVRRSDSAQRHPGPVMGDCLGVRGFNRTAKRQERSGEVPPGTICGSRILPFDQKSLENKHTRGFKRISDITPSTEDIKPYSEINDTHTSSGQSLTIGVNACSGAKLMPQSNFETDMNYNTRSVPKQFVENRNQYSYVHGKSGLRMCKNGDCNSDNLSFMLKKNQTSQGYSIYKPQVIEDGDTGEPLAMNIEQYSGNTNEVIDTNNKSQISNSSLLFEEKQNDYIYSSRKQSDHLNYQHSLPVEQHSQGRTRSGESIRKRSLSGRGSDQRCSVCGEMFQVAGDLQKHLISHKQQCHFCGESFEELEHLSAHLDMHLNNGVEGRGDEGHCEDNLHLSCDGDAPDHAIDRHDVDVKGQQKNYRCEICSKLFVAKQTLRIHMNIHLGRRSTCPVCKQTFSTDWSVKRHAGKCHHKVKVCEKSFSSPNSLKIQKAHENFVEKEDQSLFTCEVCEKEFSSLKSLSNHSRTHQRRVEELHKYVKTFGCKECDHVYSRPDSLMAHMKVHGDKYRHTCAVCFVGFPTLTELDSHMQQHTHEDKKLNTCSFCGRGFDLHTSFIQHIQHCRKTQQDAVHGRALEDFMVFERDQEKCSNNNRFQCSVCSKMYLSKKSLRHHMKVKGHITPSD
ncbi:zinc finger protein 184-like [Haliotis rubra]|uniref:zinc finger protein 184-like n=1 Tax=Haliotis rubra TaxID=36100 RepID=UPI001EE5C8DD|nr:zinc finger protein 184-like [Haliotis rubra]